MTVSVPTAELIGTFLEMLGYGIYLVVLPQTVLTLRRKELSKSLTIYLYGSMIVSFILITMHLVADLARAFIAFTANTYTRGAPEAYYANVDTKLTLVKNSTLVLTTLVADALLLYRTFVIWGRKWWILILPLMLFCLDIGTRSTSLCYFHWTNDSSHVYLVYLVNHQGGKGQQCSHFVGFEPVKVFFHSDSGG